MGTLPRALLVTLLALATPVVPQFVGPNPWPIERLCTNLERHVAEHPGDVDALYALGRAHGWAFCYELEQVNLFWGESVPVEETLRFLASPQLTDARQREFRSELPLREPPSPEAMRAHLEAALRALLQARARAPERAEIALTLGTVLEHGAHLASLVDSPALFGWKPESSLEDHQRILRRMQALGDPALAPAAVRETLAPEWFERSLHYLWCERASASEVRQRQAMALLERAWLERAAENLRAAFEGARRADAELEEVPLADLAEPLEQLISHEAAQALLRIHRRGVPGIELERVEAHLRTLAQLPPSRAITPLLLSLREGCPTLDELTLPNLAVPFDLDGDAIDELWPWLAPDAGWLVWDPEQRGEITSGLQLFGSASAWLFFADGYRVLDALDDDRDGELRNQELTGIAVWFDRDTDGVSDPGEVVPVEELGLVALATEATERIGRSLGNQAGAELASGRRLATYDWVLSPARPSAQQ